MYTNRSMRIGAQLHQQAKEKRGAFAPTGQGEEKHMYNSRPRRSGAHVHQQAKEKRGPCDILTIC
jgi:hypothetical protein